MPDSGDWVVILNWNGRQDTLACVASVLSTGGCPTLLVVDNGSGDGILDEVKVRHPGVRVLQTGSNLGYAGGNNAGLCVALEAGAATVCILNNDTLATPGFLEPLTRQARAESVAVSPLISYVGSDDGWWFAGGCLDRVTGIPRHLAKEELLPDVTTRTSNSEILTGCCLVASRSTWQTVGLFDEDFFLIFEDAEWSVRASSVGVELRVVGASVIEHRVSRSFVGAANLLGSYYYSRNGLLFADKTGASRRVFLWHHVLLPSLRDVRRRRQLDALPLRWAGVRGYVTGERGRAPAHLGKGRLARAGRDDASSS